MATVRNLTVVMDFFDGTLAEDFEKLGYPARWTRGERRNLPEWLVRRVADSGGQITVASPSARESAFVEGAEPRHTEAKFGRVRVRVVFPEGFRDGTLADDFARLNHPATFGVGEIADLPVELIEKIKLSGGRVIGDADTLQQYESQQGKHRIVVEQWQREREQAAERAKRHQETEKRNKAILAEIEDIDREYPTATGATKEALWQRRKDLRKNLK